jgi:hypothetical protein
MPPTTLKLPPELKQRIQAVAAKRGESVHAFMIGAIELETTLAEQRADFVGDALEARDELERTRSGYDAADVHAYFRARAAGKRATPPKARRWRR